MTYTVGPAHDLFVRNCFSDLELAKAFFHKFIHPDTAKYLDLDELKPGGKESFVDKKLALTTTDLLFEAPIHGHNSFLSLLVEHKSEGARRNHATVLPFQMRSQEIEIMKYGQRNNPQKCFPLVHLVALYHGPRPYPGPHSVSELMDAPDALIPNRWRERMILVDLSACSDDELLRDGKLGIFLLVLKHIYSSDILHTLKLMRPLLKQVDEEGEREFIKTLFIYLYKASKLENRGALDHIATETFQKETGDMIMTLGERDYRRGLKEGEEKSRERYLQQGREEGLERGLEKGVAKGISQVARTMINRGSTNQQVHELTGLSIPEIRALREEI